MALNIEELEVDLGNITGAKYVSSNIFERINYCDTPIPYDVERAELPDIVVHPADANEISQILEYANSKNIPVTTFGSGTSLIFSTKPKHHGIILSTERLNSFEIREDFQWFECGAGVKTGYAIKELGKLGYFLPIQTQPGSTIGGAVGINTIGHLADNIYSRPVSNVLSLEVVLPTGEIIRTGSKCLRRSAGWDLTRIFIGSEGTLGIITKIRMVLHPMPAIVDGVAFFKTAEEIGEAIALIYKLKLPLPMDAEFVDEKVCKDVRKTSGLDIPAGHMLIIKSNGKDEVTAQKNLKELLKFLNDLGATESFFLEDEKVREKVWGIRENTERWGKEKGSNGMSIEINPPLPLLSTAMKELSNITTHRNDFISQTESYLYGHVGADSLHCLFVFPYDWPAERMKEAVALIWKIEKEFNIKYDGVGGDWGQLPYRVPFYREKYGEDSYRIIKKMKIMFDPRNILNRGNVEGEI